MNIKKFLPFILIGLGIVIVGLIFFFVAKKPSSESMVEEEVVKEIPADQRPAISLTPKSDGHWLKLLVEKIKVEKAASMDYELLYSLPDGRTQGVPGTVKLTGGDIERDLLLGSESSGKFRYDEGVETGTITLRFRDEKGKLLGKLSSQFHMQTGTKELSSADGNFKYTLDKLPTGVFFVTMPTFAEPSSAMVYADGYAVFSSDGKAYTGN